MITVMAIALSFSPLIYVRFSISRDADERRHFELPFIAVMGTGVPGVVAPLMYYASNAHLRRFVWREMREMRITI